MSLNWMDVSELSFHHMLLLEEVQLSWLPGWISEQDLRLALQANPVVEWYIRHKCPRLNDWLDRVMALPQDFPVPPEQIRQAEVNILQSMEDLLVYAIDPAIYDAQPFLGWDDGELLSLVDFSQKTVVDVGAGTGRLTFAIARLALAVFAVEPVANLRKYLLQKAKFRNLANIYPLDGIMTSIPLPAGFADITMAGHVFGDDPVQEYAELARITRVGGMIILCPGNNDADNDIHRALVEYGFHWSRFEEPGDGWKRKYWKIL